MTQLDVPVVPATNGRCLIGGIGLDAIRVTEWLPSQRPRSISLAEAGSADGVLCFVVDRGAEPEFVFQALYQFCGGELDRESIEDLMSPDELPRVNEYGGGTIRKVSAFGAHAEQDNQGAGHLVFELVEFLANKRWLIVCCHEAHSFAGADRGTQSSTSRETDWLVKAAQARWEKGSLATAGDLGILMLHHLTCSYSKTRRTLLAWLENWELQWYRGNEADQDTLVDLRGLAAEFRARLNALNQPSDEVVEGWFTGVENEDIARRADRRIERSLEALDRLSDMLRSSFELLHSQRTAEQLQLQRVQADRTDKLQEKIEKITSIFLVPTLVAGFFGANTALPGGNDTRSWMSFELMVAMMVLGSLAAYFGLAWFREHERKQLEREAEKSCELEAEVAT